MLNTIAMLLSNKHLFITFITDVNEKKRIRKSLETKIKAVPWIYHRPWTQHRSRGVEQNACPD